MYSNLVKEKIYIPLKNGSYIPYINFDNAATTPPLTPVIEEINNLYPYYSSVHRGVGYKSILSSNYYEEAREIVLDFVSAPKDYMAIFVKNTTEAINKLAHLLEEYIKDGLVLTTEMEHHSNILPWRYKYSVDYVKVDEKGRLDLNHLEDLLKTHKGKVKLVAVNGASNVTGCINPIYTIAKIAHKHGAKILVDGAQLVAHYPMDMAYPEPIDFLAFSGHKIYAPFGAGALIGPERFFNSKTPSEVGGGTVKLVTKKEVQWVDLPYREEAGTPNFFGAIALAQALDTLSSIGLEDIAYYERGLLQYTLEQLELFPEITVYGDFNIEERIPIISFNIEGLHHGDTATILANEGGIGVRNGCFCTQLYVHKLLGISLQDIERLKANKNLPRPGMVRISYGLYNTYEEIDRFLNVLERLC